MSTPNRALHHRHRHLRRLSHRPPHAPWHPDWAAVTSAELCEASIPNVTATEARRHFGKVLTDAKSDPVFVFKDGDLEAVVLSWDAFKRVVDRNNPQGVRPFIEELLPKMIERYRSVFVALSKLG